MKGNKQYPDVTTVRENARAKWLEQHQSAISVQERIGESVPWWLVIIALVFFLLSIPHTMTVFGKITPYVGYVAPFGIEFGLLYAAFRRKQNKAITAYMLILEVLLFVTAVIVNGAGSFYAVVDATEQVKDMSFSDLMSEYPDLPATSQVALLLAPLAAFIIPIGTAVAGEGLAALFLERRESGDLVENEWQRVRAMVEFEALRDAALANEWTPRQATKWAEDIAFYQGPDARGQKRTVSATDSTGQTVDNGGQADHQGPDARGQGTGRGYSKKMDARERVQFALSDQPELADLSVRELADMVGVGKTTAAEELNKWKSSSNGHS